MKSGIPWTNEMLIPTSAFPFGHRWTLPDAVELALLLEASAPKAGNVHPRASFADMSYVQFVATAMAVRRSLRQAEHNPAISVGDVIVEMVLAMRKAVECNTSLGSLLLFGPIVKSYSDRSATLRERLRVVLAELTPDDSRSVYRAIQLANPGGMGQQNANDVAGQAPADLLSAMAQVASFDAVARQYTTTFADIFERTLPWLNEELLHSADVLDAICRLQLRWLAYEPDGLIIRKAGAETARSIQAAASSTWQTCQSSRCPLAETKAYQRLDQQLRGDGHRLNPGTTADLIAATLLVKLLCSDSSSGPGHVVQR